MIFDAMIRVMIFEDNQDLAEGLAGIIDESGDFELCGIFANAF